MKKGMVIKMMDQNCAYCMQGELLDKFGIYICDLDVSILVLFKEQSKRGRCIVAYKEHVSEMIDISDSERNAFMADVARVSKALHAAFKPDKVNYGAYGDTGCHLHMHLVPKYKDGDEWGGVFAMNPGKVFLSEDEYEDMIAEIKRYL
jgi:diadenosine tetraphosphate (Ap4A) HIT family hydrolase